MKIIFGTGFMLMFICFGFTFHKEIDYQVIPLTKISLDQKFRPTCIKTGTFLYTDPKQLKEAFSTLSTADMASFDFEANRYVHIQYQEQTGCKEALEVVQEVRKYKHYYEVILVPYTNGACTTRIKPYQVMTVPNDGLPVLITGTLPE